MLAQFSGLLRITKPLPDDRLTRTINARLVGMGLGDVCNRCGGSGRYSYNPVHGTTCYGCNGAGRHAPVLNAVTYERAMVAVESGALDSYFANAQRKARLGKSIDITHAALAELKHIASESYRNFGHLASQINHLALCAQLAKDPDVAAKLTERFQIAMDEFLAKVKDAKGI